MKSFSSGKDNRCAYQRPICPPPSGCLVHRHQHYRHRRRRVAARAVLLRTARREGHIAAAVLEWCPERHQELCRNHLRPRRPTGSGFWHWAVADIPATVTELSEGAGDDTGSQLPKGAYQLPNDARVPHYIGAAPPAGHGQHRYFIVVHALDIPVTGVPADATPAVLGFTMAGHTLGRAVLIATAETSA